MSCFIVYRILDKLQFLQTIIKTIHETKLFSMERRMCAREQRNVGKIIIIQPHVAYGIHAWKPYHKKNTAYIICDTSIPAQQWIHRSRSEIYRLCRTISRAARSIDHIDPSIAPNIVHFEVSAVHKSTSFDCL